MKVASGETTEDLFELCPVSCRWTFLVETQKAQHLPKRLDQLTHGLTVGGLPVGGLPVGGYTVGVFWTPEDVFWFCLCDIPLGDCYRSLTSRHVQGNAFRPGSYF